MNQVVALLILLGWPSLYFVPGGLRLIVRAALIGGLVGMALLIVGSMAWAAAMLAVALG